MDDQNSINQANNELNETKKINYQVEANKRYRQKHKEIYNQYQSQLEKNKYQTNEAYREMKRIKNLERYHKKKELLKQQNQELLSN